MKKIKLTLFASFILLFTNCEKDFDENQQVISNNHIHVKEYSFKELSKQPKFNNSFNKVATGIKNKQQDSNSKDNKEESINFAIDSTTIKEIVYNDKTTYTMLVVREDSNLDFFENYIVEVDINNNVSAFLIKYTPDENILEHEEHNSFTFHGKSEMKQIDYDSSLFQAREVNVECKTILVCNYGGSVHAAGANCTQSYTILDCTVSNSGGSSTGGNGSLGNTGAGTGGTQGGNAGGPSGGSSSNNNNTTTNNDPVITTPVLTEAILDEQAKKARSRSFYNTLTTTQKTFLSNNLEIKNDILDYLENSIRTNPNEYSQESLEFINNLINEIINNSETQPLLENNITIIENNIGNQITDINKYLECFQLNQGAVFTLYVDQPTANSNTSWSGTPLDPNVGHTFISIKQGSIRRVLGFYPSTPVDLTNTATPGVFENNSAHEFDTSISFNINSSQLTSLVDYIKLKATVNYDLNNFNCTDFGMGASSTVGLPLASAYGTWGFPGVGSGGGDNPGQLGQNIRYLPPPNGAVINTTGGNSQSNSGTCN